MRVPPRTFAALCEEFLREYFRREPVFATCVGVHDHDDDLGDHSRDAYLERDGFARAWERRLAAVPEADLSGGERVDRELLLAQLRGELALAPQQLWARHAPAYVAAIAFGVYALLAHDFAPAEERFSRIAARLSRARGVLEAAAANLDAARTAPVHVVVAGEAAAGAAAFVRGYLPSVAPEGPAKRDVLLAGREAGEALDRFASWLRDDLMKRAQGSFAIGRDAFEALLRRRHLLTHDAASLARLGREAYEEARGRLGTVARELGSDDWTAAALSLKRDHPDANALVDTYRAEVARAREAVRELDLVTLPQSDEPPEVVATPDFQRPTSPYAAYFAPAPFDPQRKGYLFVTLPDASGPPADVEQRLQGHARAAIPVTVVHEAYPGHHVQNVRAADHPSAVRRTFRTPLLGEGWALYCEELMAEAGYLAAPATRLLQLRDLLLRAMRVLLDVGLATGEMNFEQAVRALVDGAALERPNAIAEVRRYTLNPTQPSSYLVGFTALSALRERARARGIARKEFHDRLLALGSIPPALAARELGV